MRALGSEYLRSCYLMYFRGLEGKNGHKSSRLWQQGVGHQVFEAAMSQNRFKFLLGRLRFENHAVKNWKWRNDTEVKYVGKLVEEQLLVLIEPNFHKCEDHESLIKQSDDDSHFISCSAHPSHQFD